MRFNEFRIIEAEDKGIKAGPPYPAEDIENVKTLQRKLQQLGYSVGSTGIDGKYGPRTTRAVRAYKKDNNISTDGTSLTSSEFAQLLKAKPVAKPTPVIKTAKASAAGVEKLASSDDAVGAKQAAEEFLGREMSDDEFNYLVRATAAEASPNSSERAAVAAVILNRARSSTYPDHIIRVLTQKNQFQAVTGTRFDRGPSKNFTGMSQRTAEQIYASFIDKLPQMDKGWLNFTSNVRAAYGAGTNIAFLDKMKRADNAQIIGKTVFGTV
jgi:peptidoglycan hydrolase-like protein with peptidoglycan-binding domain